MGGQRGRERERVGRIMTATRTLPTLALASRLTLSRLVQLTRNHEPLPDGDTSPRTLPQGFGGRVGSGTKRGGCEDGTSGVGACTEPLDTVVAMDCASVAISERVRGSQSGGRVAALLISRVRSARSPLLLHPLAPPVQATKAMHRTASALSRMARTAAVPRPALAGHLHRSLATVSHQVPLGSGTSIPVDLDDQQTKTLRPTDEMQGFDISAQESSTPRSVSPLPLLARSRKAGERNQLRNPLAACASYADTVPRAQQPGERRPPDLPRRPGDHPDGPSRARRHAALHDQHGARPFPPPPPPSLYSCRYARGLALNPRARRRGQFR